eukprot:g4755.t1
MSKRKDAAAELESPSSVADADGTAAPALKKSKRIDVTATGTGNQAGIPVLKPTIKVETDSRKRLRTTNASDRRGDQSSEGEGGGLPPSKKKASVSLQASSSTRQHSSSSSLPLSSSSGFVLPVGWKTIKKKRKDTGREYVSLYISPVPECRRFRSLIEVKRFLGIALPAKRKRKPPFSLPSGWIKSKEGPYGKTQKYVTLYTAPSGKKYRSLKSARKALESGKESWSEARAQLGSDYDSDASYDSAEEGNAAKLLQARNKMEQKEREARQRVEASTKSDASLLAKAQILAAQRLAKLRVEHAEAREKLRHAHERELEKAILRLKRFDKYAIFLEPVDPEYDPNYLLEIKNPMDLGTISKFAKAGKYYRRKEGFTWCDKNPLTCQHNIDLAADRKNLVFDSMGVIDWETLLKDLNLVVFNACSYNPESDEPGDVYREAVRLGKHIKEVINSSRSRTIREASALMTEEELDRLQAVNQEPAMQGEWRKIPYTVRAYETITGQVPATDCDGDGVKGIPVGRGINKGREARRVLRDLNTTLLGLSKRAAREAEHHRRRKRHEAANANQESDSASTGVMDLAGTIEDVKDAEIGPEQLVPRWLKAEGGASPVRKSKPRSSPGNKGILHRGLSLGVELRVSDVWGIDCHTRKSIITAVEGGCKNPKAVLDTLLEGDRLAKEAATQTSAERKRGKKGKKSKQEIAYEKQGLKLVNGLLVPVVKESPEIQKMKALIATLPHSVGPKCKVESFVSKWLLPAINAQSAKEAHDMRFALRHILAKIALDETEADLDEVGDLKRIKRAKISNLRAVDTGGNSIFDEEEARTRDDDKCTTVEDGGKYVVDMARAVLAAYRRWGDHNFRIFPKGKGVIVQDSSGVRKGHFINEYLGEVYPSWLFSERQNILDRLQTLCCGARAKVLPDFWNMQLERHPEDPYGRQLFTIDPSHRANFCSRLSHSCTPNCQTACVAISDDGINGIDGNRDGNANRRYTVVLHSVREVAPGEELTIDYNAVTPSKDEYQLATCLCGSPGCRGSFLYLSAMDAHQQVLRERHTPLQRMAMMVQACRDPRDALRTATATLKHRAEADEMTIKRERAKVDELVANFINANIPKKGASSFFLFSNQRRKELAEMNPDMYKGKLNLTAKIAGEEWHKQTSEERAHWDEQARAVKAEKNAIRKEFLAGPATLFRKECCERVDMFEEDLRGMRHNAFRRAILWWQTADDESEPKIMSLRNQRLKRHGFAPTVQDGVTLRALPEWAHVFAARVLGFVEMENHELSRRLKEMSKLSSAAAKAIKDKVEKEKAEKEKTESTDDDDPETEFWRPFAHPCAHNFVLNEKQVAEGWILGRGKPSPSCPPEKVVHPLIGTRVARQWGGVKAGTETTTSLGTIVAALAPEKSGDPQWYFINAHDDGDQEELEVFEIEAGSECLSDLVDSGFVDNYAQSISEEERQKTLEDKRKAKLQADAKALKLSLEQAAGVYDQRVSNLCVTLDRVRQILRDSSFISRGSSDSSMEVEDNLLKLSAAPMHVLTDEQVAGFLWNDEHSVVRRLFRNLVEAFCLTDTAAAIKQRQDAATMSYTHGFQKTADQNVANVSIQEVNLLPGVTERAKISDALFKTAQNNLQAYVKQEDDIAASEKVARADLRAKAQHSKALWKKAKSLKNRALKLRTQYVQAAQNAGQSTHSLIESTCKDISKSAASNGNDSSGIGKQESHVVSNSSSDSISHTSSEINSYQASGGSPATSQSVVLNENLKSLAANAEKLAEVAETEASEFDKRCADERHATEMSERLELQQFQEKHGEDASLEDMCRPLKPPGACGDLETVKIILRIADLVQTWAWTGDQARQALTVVCGEIWKLCEGNDGGSISDESDNKIAENEDSDADADDDEEEEGEGEKGDDDIN